MAATPKNLFFLSESIPQGSIWTAAGHSGHVAAMAGLRLPIETHVLQAMVSEPLKPVLDTVVTFGAGHFYVSQSDKGELVMGGDIDMYNSYGQRGNLPPLAHAVSCALALFPSFGRLRSLGLQVRGAIETAAFRSGANCSTPNGFRPAQYRDTLGACPKGRESA